MQKSRKKFAKTRKWYRKHVLKPWQNAAKEEKRKENVRKVLTIHYRQNYGFHLLPQQYSGTWRQWQRENLRWKHIDRKWLQECNRTDTEAERCSKTYPTTSCDTCASCFRCCKPLQRASKGRFPPRASRRKLPSESTAEEQLSQRRQSVKKRRTSSNNS